MPIKRLLTQFSIALTVSLVVGLLFSPNPAGGSIQHIPSNIEVTLLPDYSTSRVEVVGTVSSSEVIQDIDDLLAESGLGGEILIWPANNQGSDRTYHFQGFLENAFLSLPDENGRYLMTLGPYALNPGDIISFAVPFTNLVMGEISPQPHNMEEIEDPISPLTYFRYIGSENFTELTLKIPFIPIQREIEINMFPLVGEMIQNQQDSYRLYGQVIFKGITDLTEFGKYCQPSALDWYWPYRTADTLFSLDALPVLNFGYLPPAYQFKPSYLLVRSELLSCSYEDGSGQVTTSITGRIFKRSNPTKVFPEILIDQDIQDKNIEVQQRGRGMGLYEMQLGLLALGPGDLLKINLPGSEGIGISPEPAKYTINEDGDMQVEFRGPNKLVLRVRYAPQPQIFLQQLPATIRTLSSQAENQLSSLAAGPTHWQSWTVLVVALAVIAAVQKFSNNLKLWLRYLIWFLAGMLSYYSFQHVFGLIFFAIGVQLIFSWYNNSREMIQRSIFAMLAAFVFLVLDWEARELIFLLDGYQLEMTQFTPLLLLILGLLFFLIYRGSKQTFSWLPRDILSAALVLFAFSVLDGLQKSFPAVVITGILIFMIIRRFNNLVPDGEPETDLNRSAEFQSVWRARFIWLGFLVFAIYIILNDITNTTEVLSPSLGLARHVLDPLLLFFSVILSFLAIGGLFFLLYPILPFNQGYLKAIIFAFGLMLVFILGIGADSRLIIALPNLLVGRFIYYLSAPLLIGIYLEVPQGEKRIGAEGEEGILEEEASSAGNLFDRIFDPIKSFLGPVSSLISLVAPALYAWFSDQPLVTSYFDILEVLMTFI